MMISKIDTYTTYARIFPGVLTSLPLFVLWFFVIRDTEWRSLLDFVVGMKILGTVSMSAVFIYFYSQFIRITSKHFERKYFTGARGFPTTYFMLYSDQTFSNDYKAKFRERVKKILKLDPLNEEGEKQNPKEAASRLNECFNHIRLKVGGGKLVLKHNIWYGFSRNIIGGSIYAVIICVSNILLGWLVFQSRTLVIISSVLLLIYLVILGFRRALLVQNGEAYARQLISEFMTTGVK